MLLSFREQFSYVFGTNGIITHVHLECESALKLQSKKKNTRMDLSHFISSNYLTMVVFTQLNSNELFPDDDIAVN